MLVGLPKTQTAASGAVNAGSGPCRSRNRRWRRSAPNTLGQPIVIALRTLALSVVILSALLGAPAWTKGLGSDFSSRASGATNEVKAGGIHMDEQGIYCPGCRAYVHFWSLSEGGRPPSE